MPSVPADLDDDDDGAHSDSDYDYEEGAFKVECGGTIKDDRFEVLRTAGKGTFGVVVEAFDSKHRDVVALKIVRSVPRYLVAAETEIEILNQIRHVDKHGVSLCVRLLGSFSFRSTKNEPHVAISFERCGASLYQFLKDNHFNGFSLKHVKMIGYQLIHAIVFCHEHMKLVHTDLKPENILLKNSASVERRDSNYSRGNKKKSSSTTQGGGGARPRLIEPKDPQIRLIDFGGATFETDHHARIINTRQYRSPEVQLGCAWSYPSDIWSIGCILVELFTGELLFPTHDELEHLAMLEKTLGKTLPKYMIREAISTYKHRMAKGNTSSTRRGDDTDVHELVDAKTTRLRFPEKASRSCVARVDAQRHIHETLGGSEQKQLLDLVKKTLRFAPMQRITARKALEHPFFDSVRNRMEHMLLDMARGETGSKKSNANSSSSSSNNESRKRSGNHTHGNGDKRARKNG